MTFQLIDIVIMKRDEFDAGISRASLRGFLGKGRRYRKVENRKA